TKPLAKTEVMSGILNGEVHKECPQAKSTIYLYIVSGNTDMEVELTHMQEHLYPKLRDHFSQRGHELRVLDLHWGFRDTVSDDHGIPRVLHQAISKAHHSEFGINFVILLGQKYGHCPLPLEIPKEELEKILKAATEYKKEQKQIIKDAGSEKKQRKSVILRDTEQELPDTKALRQWYILDENSIPAVYRLQNISTMFKDITRNDAAKRQVTKLAFASIETRLRKILKTFSVHVTNDEVDGRQQSLVVLEHEISSVCDLPTAIEHMVCVVRTLDHLTENLDDLSAGDYVDLAPGSEAALDSDKTTRMEAIKHRLMDVQTDENRLAVYSVDWTSGGIRPHVHRAHSTYTDRMCKTLFNQIVNHPDLKTPAEAPSTWKHELFYEVSEHVRICQERARVIQDCEHVLDKIQSYLLSDTRRPLVVHGQCGCGKSTILAAAAVRVHSWMKGKKVNPHVLVRMIGCTSNSTNIRTLLRDVSRQLCHVFDQSPLEIPTVRTIVKQT
ncbi:unnamed protein product, partial [Candidula unifasciata]